MADEDDRPPYYQFSDKTLREMARGAQVLGVHPDYQRALAAMYAGHERLRLIQKWISQGLMREEYGVRKTENVYWVGDQRFSMPLHEMFPSDQLFARIALAVKFVP